LSRYSNNKTPKQTNLQSSIIDNKNDVKIVKSSRFTEKKIDEEKVNVVSTPISNYNKFDAEIGKPVSLEFNKFDSNNTKKISQLNTEKQYIFNPNKILNKTPNKNVELEVSEKEPPPNEKHLIEIRSKLNLNSKDYKPKKKKKEKRKEHPSPAPGDGQPSSFSRSVELEDLEPIGASSVPVE